MLERPDYAVQTCIELISRHIVELFEVIFDDSFEELEECLPDLWIRAEVNGDHLKSWVEDHLHYLTDKLWSQDRVQFLKYNCKEGDKFWVLQVLNRFRKQLKCRGQRHNERLFDWVHFINTESGTGIDVDLVQSQYLLVDISHFLGSYIVDNLWSILPH